MAWFRQMSASELKGGAEAAGLPLAGRHAVVTGGGKGIGAAIADALDSLGASLTLMGRDLPAVTAKAATLQRARALAMDVTDASGLEPAFEAAAAGLGDIDILVNNAGAARSAPFSRTDDELWDFMLAVNLTGVMRCTRAVLPGMSRRGWGRVINIASTAGLKGYAYTAAYTTAKHGVIGLTRVLALETARKGVTVNAVCPGFTETDLLADSLDNIMAKTGCTREEAANQIKAVNPQHRFVQPAEVAATVAWLCCPGSESVTGQSIAVAGGEVM